MHSSSLVRPSSPCVYILIASDRVIQKKRREYSDPNSSNNMKKINDDLASIHNVMRKTIDDVLDRYEYDCIVIIGCLYVLFRGNKLEDVSNISQNLASESKKYKFSAQQMSFLVSGCCYIDAFIIVLVGADAAMGSVDCYCSHCISHSGH